MTKQRYSHDSTQFLLKYRFRQYHLFLYNLLLQSIRRAGDIPTELCMARDIGQLSTHYCVGHRLGHLLLHQSKIWGEMDSIQLSSDCWYGGITLWNSNIQRTK